MTGKKSSAATVLSLAQLLERQPATSPPCLVEPGLLPPQGILFVGGEPKVGKSLLVEEYALHFGAAFPGGVFWLLRLWRGLQALGKVGPVPADAGGEDAQWFGCWHRLPEHYALRQCREDNQGGRILRLA